MAVSTTRFSAGQRLRAITRAALKFWGPAPGADVSQQKPPDLCHGDFLEVINKSNNGLVPMLGRWTKAGLTSGSANTLIDIPLPAGGMIGFVVKAVTYATDGTDMQAFTELIQVAAVNKAASYTSTVTNLSTTGAKAVSAGTLTTSWTITTGTNVITLNVTPTTSLTATTLACDFEIMIPLSFTTANGVYPAFQ